MRAPMRGTRTDGFGCDTFLFILPLHCLLKDCSLDKELRETFCCAKVYKEGSRMC